MLRFLAVVTAAAARPENASAYFDAASRLYPSRSPRAHPSGWTRTQLLSRRDSHAEIGLS